MSSDDIVKGWNVGEFISPTKIFKQCELDIIQTQKYGFINTLMYKFKQKKTLTMELIQKYIITSIDELISQQTYIYVDDNILDVQDKCISPEILKFFNRLKITLLKKLGFEYAKSLPTFVQTIDLCKSVYDKSANTFIIEKYLLKEQHHANKLTVLNIKVLVNLIASFLLPKEVNLERIHYLVNTDPLNILACLGRLSIGYEMIGLTINYMYISPFIVYEAWLKENDETRIYDYYENNYSKFNKMFKYISTVPIIIKLLPNKKRFDINPIVPNIKIKIKTYTYDHDDTNCRPQITIAHVYKCTKKYGCEYTILCDNSRIQRIYTTNISYHTTNIFNIEDVS